MNQDDTKRSLNAIILFLALAALMFVASRFIK